MTGATVGQDALQRLDAFLADHPHLTVVREDGSLTVRGKEAGGFDVHMLDDGRVATIFAGGWHEHYNDAEQAAATFMWLLTPKTKIVLSFRGRSQIGWKLQWDEDGKWMTGGRGTILLPFLFWGPKREETFQNRLLDR